MSTPQSEELQRQVKEILDGMKKRDTELGDVMKKTQEDVTNFGKIQEGTKEAVATLTTKGAELHGRLHELEQKMAAIDEKATAPGKTLSLGEKFIADPKLKEYVKVARSAGKTSQRFDVSAYGVKTITSIDASAGQGVWSTRLPSVIEEPLRTLSIRDLIDTGTTDSNLIEWVRENVYTNNADVVSEGALKPESNITYERVDVPVRTIAHWIRASKQVLADFKQLQTMINGRMRWGLRIKEEDQILYGDGTGENLLGLVPQATDYNTALNNPDDTQIDIIRHAILQVRLAFYPATGIVLSPTDWHNIELTKDNENRYLMASPTQRTPPMLWGLPVVESDGMATSGEFLVGAFRMAATLFDREEAAILLSTEDQDNFVRNLVTILCEERLALAVTRPKAFVHGSFFSGSTT
jgi:HK97 family phage major capsid protein